MRVAKVVVASALAPVAKRMRPSSSRAQGVDRCGAVRAGPRHYHVLYFARSLAKVVEEPQTPS